MLAQRRRQCARAPDEHTAVPKIVPCVQEFLRTLCVWLLGKPADPTHTMIKLLASFNVAVPSFSTIGLDAHHNDILTAACDGNRECEILLELLLVRDHMVRRKQSEDGVRIMMQQDECGEPDRRSGVATDRFGDDLLLL